MRVIENEEYSKKAEIAFEKRHRREIAKSRFFRVVGVIMGLCVLVFVPWVTAYAVNAGTWLMGLVWDVGLLFAFVIILFLMVYSFNLIKDGTW